MHARLCAVWHQLLTDVWISQLGALSPVGRVHQKDTLALVL